MLLYSGWVSHKNESVKAYGKLLSDADQMSLWIPIYIYISLAWILRYWSLIGASTLLYITKLNIVLLGLRSYAAWLCLNPKWADNVLTGAIAFVNCMNIETFPSSYKILSCSTLKSIIHLLRTFTWEPQGWASSFKIEKKAFVTWYYWHLLWTVWILTSKSIFLRFELFIVQGDLYLLSRCSYVWYPIIL